MDSSLINQMPVISLQAIYDWWYPSHAIHPVRYPCIELRGSIYRFSYTNISLQEIKQMTTLSKKNIILYLNRRLRLLNKRERVLLDLPFTIIYHMDSELKYTFRI